MTIGEIKSTAGRRIIRSFVLRQGRLTASQQAALDALWPRYGIEAGAGPIEPDRWFGRVAPLVVEIGFGNGDSLAEMALATPETNFVGIEVHTPGVGHLLVKIRETGLENIRIIRADAVEVLSERLADASIDRLQIYFPDPWHKKRHHKRRLINPDFVEIATSKLRPGGVLHCATDWEDYAIVMRETLEAVPRLRNIAGPGNFSERPAYRPETKFERRGQRLGHGVWDLLFERVA